ncbi:MAG: YraN family protein, partial [Chloroflexi bacterium]|nr:YraN family protein [Chloroflexota bacterium]
ESEIIARDGETLVFVEVRAKKSRAFGSPEESITPAKMTKLRQTAARYQQERENLPASARIDVVAIELDRANRPLRVAVIENAIGEC